MAPALYLTGAEWNWEKVYTDYVKAFQKGEKIKNMVRGGLKEGLKPGSVVVDCSTADPNSTIALAEELAPLGIEFVDAPLSRTPKEAWAGTLDTMVGASEATFA